MNTRGARTKRVKQEKPDYVYELESNCSGSTDNDPDDQEAARKSKIRDTNKEYAKRMTILQSWSNYWNDYTTRQGDAYPPLKAREILRKAKKITCPIESCNKSFTTYGGLKYHYARCNIERCFKCNVCEPSLEVTTKGELLKHMILLHYNTLPELDEGQKEIANHFLAGSQWTDKSRKDKVFGDVEPPTNSTKLVKAFKDLQDRVFRSAKYDERPYKHWRSNLSDWEQLTHEFDKSKFYPPEFNSVHFKSRTDQQQVDIPKDDWKSIRTGESCALRTNKENGTISTVFYTGGVNTASAWLPKPPHDDHKNQDLIAIAIDCNSLDQSRSYKQCHRGEACIQFWRFCQSSVIEPLPIPSSAKSKLSVTLQYMMAHNYGTIFDMVWCPLGASWESRITLEDQSVHGRLGLLALACGDGHIRIISVPHTCDLSRSRMANKIVDTVMDATPIYKAKPVATLVHPGIGQSTDSQPVICRTIDWCLEANQRYIAAGYTNGTIALFDLQNTSPIIYSNTANCHIHQPLKSCIAHGAPVTGIAISINMDTINTVEEPLTTKRGDNDDLDRILIASGSTDRLLRIWHVIHDNCINSERAPITKILWDYRFRGIITACDTAFTSFNNRVSYRYPLAEGHQNITISVHHSIVWGLANSIITNAIATSDGAGEVFVMPQTFNRLSHKRERSLLNIHSLYSLLPKALNLKENSEATIAINNGTNLETVEKTAADVGDFITIYPSTGVPDLMMNEIDYDENIENSIGINDDQGGGGGDNNNDEYQINADFSAIERPVVNKPTKFLLPLDHKPVDTYSRFKTRFGLEFVDYDHTNKLGKPTKSNIPESCARAGNLQNIYCDRACDYPFSSINDVIWSPNVTTFPYLLSTTHIGLCRLDRVQVVEQTYKHFVDTILLEK